MTYIQCHFCNFMVDADKFLLQLCATRLEPATFLHAVLDMFHVLPLLSLSADKEHDSPRLLDIEQEVPMMESALTFLASLITLRTNLGLSEQDLTRLEMVTLLCMGDKTHSLLSEHMPEKCGSALSKHFDSRSHLLAVNTGWQGGVFVQSCGHHVHLTCQQSYVQSLRGTNTRPTSQTLAVDRGEYQCPMCRQLANSVLPIPPDMEGQMVRARSQNADTLGHEVTLLLKEPAVSPTMSAQSQLMVAMTLIMERLTKATYPQYNKLGHHSPTMP